MNANHSSGMVLIFVLWVVLILAVLAVTLGREAGIDLALTKYAIGKFKADQLAYSGVMYALAQMQKSAPPNAEQTPEAAFHYDFQDEERKINLNSISEENREIVTELIVLLGFSKELARTVSASVVDWHDEDQLATASPWGAEENYYSSLPLGYHCKNRPFDHIEELPLVRGIGPDLFLRLKNYVTVFPKKGGALKVNFNTASETVMRALLRSKTGPMTNTTLDDAESLCRKIIFYRSGPDGQEATPDDRKVEMEKLGLNAKEEVLFLSLLQNMTSASQYFRVKVKGVDSSSGAVSFVEAVVNADDHSILSWSQK